MKRHVADGAGKIVTVDEKMPICGLSFCDECGDCLVCYGSEPCRVRPEGHRRVWYSRGDSNCTSKDSEPTENFS